MNSDSEADCIHKTYAFGAEQSDVSMGNLISILRSKFGRSIGLVVGTLVIHVNDTLCFEPMRKWAYENAPKA